MWNANILSLPEGYKPLPSFDSSLIDEKFPTSGNAALEYSHLFKNFKLAKTKPVGICLEPSSWEECNLFLSKINKIHQHYKMSRFYISTSNTEFLLFLVDAFRFFNPAAKVYKNIFYSVPNIFNTHLSEKERLLVDIKMLSSVDFLLIEENNPKLPYIKKYGSPKAINSNISPADFVFDVSKEEVL